MKNPAAVERQRKVHEWINAQPLNYLYTAKEAAMAIFGTEELANYVSSILSAHSSIDGDKPIKLVGRKKNEKGGRGHFVYMTIDKLPEPRIAFFKSHRVKRADHHHSVRKVEIIDDPSIVSMSSIAIEGIAPMITKEVTAPPTASVIERLLEIGIKYDRGGSIIVDLLELATELAREKDGGK